MVPLQGVDEGVLTNEIWQDLAVSAYLVPQLPLSDSFLMN